MDVEVAGLGLQLPDFIFGSWGPYFADLDLTQIKYQEKLGYAPDLCSEVLQCGILCFDSLQWIRKAIQGACPGPILLCSGR